eukprot:2191081-Rhodomonas_salina.1
MVFRRQLRTSTRRRHYRQAISIHQACVAAIQDGPSITEEHAHGDNLHSRPGGASADTIHRRSSRIPEHPGLSNLRFDLVLSGNKLRGQLLGSIRGYTEQEAHQGGEA